MKDFWGFKYEKCSKKKEKKRKHEEALQDLEDHFRFSFERLTKLFLIAKSSHPELFCKIGVFKKILKIHRQTPVPESRF